MVQLPPLGRKLSQGLLLEGAVRTHGVVVDAPGFDDLLHLIQRRDPGKVEALLVLSSVSYRRDEFVTVVAEDEGQICGTSALAGGQILEGSNLGRILLLPLGWPTPPLPRFG